MSDNTMTGFAAVVEKGLKELNVPGVAVAVVKDGETIFAEGFGYADLTKKVKMTADHILPIGSASKAFTATAAVMLAGQGKIDLDKTIKTYVPAFELSDPIASANATVRDLLCHRTGMPRHDLMWINWGELKRKEVVTERLRHLKASQPFRSKWQYQNHMFATVGYVVEAVSGLTWEDYVTKHIFTPLGMNTAGFTTDYSAGSARVARLYKEDKQGKNEECQPLTLAAMGPAGSINASVREMANWVKFNLSGGKAGDKALVEGKVFPELHKPNIPYELYPMDIPEKKIIGYGLGWFIDCFRGFKLVEHGGNVTGASALVSMIPEKNIGCVVLTNASGTLLTMALACEIHDRLLGFAGQKDWVQFISDTTKPMKEEAKKAVQAHYDSKLKGKALSHDAADYIGVYSHPGYGDVAISGDKQNGFRLKFHDNDLELTHMHYDIFSFEMMSMPIHVSFRTGTKGDIESLSIRFEPMVEATVFAKKPEEKKGSGKKSKK